MDKFDKVFMYFDYFGFQKFFFFKGMLLLFYDNTQPDLFGALKKGHTWSYGCIIQKFLGIYYDIVYKLKNIYYYVQWYRGLWSS